MRGEITPAYAVFPQETVDAVREVVGECRIVFSMRNPIDRAFSHYNMKVQQGWEDIPTFEEAMEKEPERLQAEYDKMEQNPRYYSKKLRNFSYLARGRYSEQLERWLEYYPIEQIRVYQSERFFEQPQEVLREIYEFIGVSDFVPDNLKVHNKRHYEAMSPETREKLRQYYQPYNERLYELTGKRFDWD